MEYKVLYRKYRPDDFSNIVDQEYIIKILQNSIKNNKIAHAYIFSGPRGTGKTTTAKVFAKAINCLNPTSSGPCGECEMCKSFNNSTDIIELDAASNNGVDEIREIIDNVKLAPSYSKYKVYIIDEVHMLTQNAFNALLLTLEEPPSNVIFIMATTNIENVPITILSRCQRFDFKKISYNELKNRIKYVCDCEKIKITDEAIGSIAELSDGGLRDALSILDQVQQEKGKIDLESIQKIYGIVPKNLIEDLILKFNEKDVDEVISKVKSFENLGINYKTLVKYTINLLREKAVLCVKNGEIDLYNKYKNIILELNKTLNEINVYINPFLLYELVFLNYILDQDDDKVTNSKQDELEMPKEVVIEKKNDIEGTKNYFPGNNFEQNELELKKNIRVNNCFVNPQKELLNEIKNSWQSFINSVTNNQILSLIVDTLPVAVSENYIIIATQSVGVSELINLDTEKLEKEINNYYKKNYFVISLTKDEWNEYKKKYISDIKNGVKYNYIEEKKDDIINKEKNIEGIAKDIFDPSKIEIN